tara:strand:- start:452 stop:880 length:429 start_codon:yes stop_codon:yes gene_type:complete
MQERKEQSTKLRSKHPDRLPIIMIPQNIEISKIKYLVPCNIEFSTFIQLIRHDIKINRYESFFCLIDGLLPTNNQSIIELYNLYSNKDGFLYINITKESTFGDIKNSRYPLYKWTVFTLKPYSINVLRNMVKITVFLFKMLG